MTELVESRADTTRQHILRAAARHFAVTPYHQVNLDDIVASAEINKSTLYSHFRSKMALAAALIEFHLDVSWEVGAKRIGMGFGGIEALVDFSFLIAAADMRNPLTRSAFNLLESVGRFDGLQARVMENWVHTFADIATRAVADGDIRSDCRPEHLARLLTSIYLGLRQTSDLDCPERFITDFEAVLLLALPGFANSERLPYLTGFVRRRSALAIKNAASLGSDKL